MAKQITKQAPKSQWSFPFTKENWVLFGIGIGVIVVGYLLMAVANFTGQWDHPLAINVAPVVLIFGYCVVIPYAIMKRKKTEKIDPQA